MLSSGIVCVVKHYCKEYNAPLITVRVRVMLWKVGTHTGPFILRCNSFHLVQRPAHDIIHHTEMIMFFFQFGYTHLTNQLTKERWTTPAIYWKPSPLSLAPYKGTRVSWEWKRERARTTRIIFPHVCSTCVMHGYVLFVFDFLFATSRTHLKPVCIHIVSHSRCVCARVRARSFLWTGQIFGRVLSVAHTHSRFCSRTCVRPFSACYLDSHVIAQSFTAGLLTRQPMRTQVSVACYQIYVSPRRDYRS
jgi:hypothetical protein